MSSCAGSQHREADPVIQPRRTAEHQGCRPANLPRGVDRIEHNADHLQRWQQGVFAENSSDWLIGHALSVLAETGSMPEYKLKNPKTKNGARLLACKYRGPLGGTTAKVTWQRLFLCRKEAAALGVSPDDRIQGGT